MPSVEKRVPFQQLTVEFRVTGDLDGVTPAPAVVLDPNDDDYNEPDSRGIHVVDVFGDLGLIDPDLGGDAAMGDRCIPWIYLDTQGLGGAAGARIAVLDNVDRDNDVPVPRSQYTAFPTGGAPVFFTDNSTYVFQGSCLGIIGYSGAGVKTIRLNIVAPHDAEEFAAILEACCCSSAECEDPPEVDDINFDRLFTQEPEDVTFDTSGGYPDAGNPPNLYLIQRTDGEGEDEAGGAVEAEFVSQVVGVSATFRVTPPADTPPGSYQPLIFDPRDQTCNNIGQSPAAPTLLIWPNGCPVLDDPQAGAPHNITLGGGAQNFTLSGENFAGPTVGQIVLVHQATGVEMGNVTFVTDSDIQLTVTATPVAPDPDGLYDVVMVPLGASCPTQKVVGVVQVLVA